MKKIRLGTMLASGLAVGIFILNAEAFASSPVLLTPAEECGYTAYSQHEEVTRFLSYLDAMSMETVVKVVGRTRETGEFPAKTSIFAS